MQKRIIWGLILLSCNLPGQYTYEANQPLYDLHDNANNFQGELAYEVVDDGISPAIDLSFDFTFTALHFHKHEWRPMVVYTLAIVVAIAATLLLIHLTDNTPIPYILFGQT